MELLKVNTVLRQIIEQELAKRENPGADEPLFLNRYGTRYRKMRKALKSACENAKVPHCTTTPCGVLIHDLARKGKDIDTILQAARTRKSAQSRKRPARGRVHARKLLTGNAEGRS